jgi:hypothetical protein
MPEFDIADLLRLAAGGGVAHDAFMAILNDPEAVKKLASTAETMRQLRGEEAPPLEAPDWNWEEVQAYVDGTLLNEEAAARVRRQLEEFVEADGPLVAALPYAAHVAAANWNDATDFIADAMPRMHLSVKEVKYKLSSDVLARLGLNVQGVLRVEHRTDVDEPRFIIEFELLSASAAATAHVTIFDQEVSGRRLLRPGNRADFELPPPRSGMYVAQFEWSDSTGTPICRRMNLPRVSWETP